VALVDEQDEYNIPGRSYARSLRELKWKDTSDDTKRNLSLIRIEQEDSYSSITGDPSAFFFMGDKVVVRPVPTDPATTEYLEFWYSLWPNRLCVVVDAALITNVSSGTLTCSTVPTTMIAGVKCDLIQGTQGNSSLAMDIAITGVAGTQVSFATADVPSSVAAGDWIALAGYSPVLQLPDACLSFLETAVCERVMQTIGDLEAAAALRIILKDEEKAIRQLLEPRIIGEATKFVNHQLLHRSSRSRFGWLYR
jgi:hypothetical protein